jgi:hypothetical protein
MTRLLHAIRVWWVLRYTWRLSWIVAGREARLPRAWRR